jgi:hypothetical protein
MNEYLIRRQVFPTDPSPTTTNLTAIGYSDIIIIRLITLTNFQTI